MTFRIVVRDVRSGSLFSVKSERPDTCPGLEPGDEIIEAVPQKVSEARPMTPEECAALTSSPGFVTVSAYRLPRLSDARPALNPVELAPWA
jgi:hypothetical protein